MADCSRGGTCKGMSRNTTIYVACNSNRVTKEPMPDNPEQEEKDDAIVQGRKLMLNLLDRFGREY